ncbi:hypothetical protein ACNOYE_36315 [Nannocystaceae bacterium ST9]
MARSPNFLAVIVSLGVNACVDDFDESSTQGEVGVGSETAGETTAGETTSGETTAGETTAGETTAGETTAGETTAGETTSGETTSGETTAGETTSDETTSGETDGPDEFDPLCGEWHALKTRANGLDEVWTDGLDILAFGQGDLVLRGDGPWLDIEAVTVDRLLTSASGVWATAIDDHWIVGEVTNLAPGVFHGDGVVLEQVAQFPQPSPASGGTLHGALEGSGPDDLWALGTPWCETFDCGIDPNCECASLPAISLHFDGLQWNEVPMPILARALWTDGATAWAVGGRDEDEGLTPWGGQVAHFDGVEWTALVLDELPGLFALWAIADELWVGGSEGTLRHFDQGLWTTHDLPTSARIVAIDGISAVEIWALDDQGELYAWDGLQWTSWLSIPQARDFVVHDDGLIVVGEEAGHWIGLVDLELETVEPIYSRDGTFKPMTMVVDDMATAVASSSGWGSAGGAGSRAWDGQSWTPVYPDVVPGFNWLVGDVNQGWGTRSVNPDFNPDPNPAGAKIHRIVDGEPLPVDAPAANLQIVATDLMEGEPWIGGRTFGGETEPFLYAREGDAWIDRLPPGLQDDAYANLAITSSGGRVFANFATFSDAATWMFEGGAMGRDREPADRERGRDGGDLA